MYELSDTDYNILGYFESIEHATVYLNTRGYSFVDIDGWTMEDAYLFTQYQFVLEKLTGGI